MNMDKKRHKIFINHLRARIKVRSKKKNYGTVCSQFTAESRQFANEVTLAEEHVQRRKILGSF